MSTKIKTLDDCVSGADYLEYAQAHELDVHKNGSYWEIEKDGVTVRFPKTDRALPKETRSLINAALVKMGLVLAVIGLVAWIIL